MQNVSKAMNMNIREINKRLIILRTSYRRNKITVRDKMNTGLGTVRENVPTISNVTSYGNHHMINGVHMCILIKTIIIFEIRNIIYYIIMKSNILKRKIE